MPTPERFDGYIQIRRRRPRTSRRPQREADADPKPRNLMFMRVSRYERASLIVTSSEPFIALSEIFGDDATTAALIDIHWR